MHNMTAPPMADHQSASRMTEEMEGSPSKAGDAGYKLENVSVRRAENGGFIATCARTKKLKPEKGSSYVPTDYQSKDYAFSSFGELSAFLESELAGPTSSNLGRNSAPVPSGSSADYVDYVEDEGDVEA